VAVGGFWDRFLTRWVERIHVNGLIKNGAAKGAKKGRSFSTRWAVKVQ
jgi:hypothetical protein